VSFFIAEPAEGP